ncbi:histidine kinase N-terminal 7TM domain-containing protein [Bacillus sp. MMSF_3328]|uniref:histidine kinase N-terminal 7TM domain-containing diguanylate cyclase n=1 Tax=Bacillus sp. MMSF_3328 TaxID=3047080 RepID=UPI00273EF9FC|nr:histidine kinase N-terminal 7TM domain-containing protein [Bacillus sp. MMSF_3328]
MTNELILYKSLVALSGVLSLCLCLFAFYKLKGAPGVKPYIIATILSSLFSFFYVFELSSSTLKGIKLWLSMEYLVMPFIPAFIFLMCAEYAGQKLKPWVIYILFLFPSATIFMHATNGLHHLYYKAVELRNDAPFPIADLEYGPFFYVHAFYMFICLTVSVLTLLLRLKGASLLFRIQLMAMAAGLVFPILANYFYLNDLSPYGIDLGPVSMSLSYLFHWVALMSFKMFDVTPILRDTVFDRMKEGVIVLNRKGAILDYNSAMVPIMPFLKPSVIGKPFKEAFSGFRILEEIIENGMDCDYEWIRDGKKIHHQVQMSDVEDKNGHQIGRIISFVNITEKILIQEQLKELASIDGLTQVYNRTYFMKQSLESLGGISPNGGDVSLIMFDIDHFKKINDEYGHETGDLVLSHVARVAKESIRAADVIGRYGGEEFIILLPDTSFDEACDLAEAIRLNVSEQYTKLGQVYVHATLSLGVSHLFLFPQVLDDPIQFLMREADQALYAAKRNGRNNVQRFVRETELTEV